MRIAFSRKERKVRTTPFLGSFAGCSTVRGFVLRTCNGEVGRVGRVGRVRRVGQRFQKIAEAQSKA